MAEELSPLLEMRGIHKRFGATAALRGVDLAVPAGEVHALVGENGAGKSTLIKALSGAIRPDAGTMRLAGKPFAPHDPLAGRRAGIAVIYQELAVVPHLSVEENILLGMEPTLLGVLRRREMRETAVRALDELGHPDIRPETIVGRLPIAEKQIVEIARAIAVGCRVLVLDEPTSSLTQADVQRLFGLIRRLKQRGLAIVYISHFLEEAWEIAGRFTVLRDGLVAGSGETAATTIDEVVRMMIGRQIGQMFTRSPRTPGEAVLEVTDLSGKSKPEHASFTLRRGEVLGIAGLLGAGRTELLRAIFGLDPVRQGRVRLGTFVGPASPSRRWRQGAGLLSEDRGCEGLAAAMTVADNMTLSKLSAFGPAGIVIPSRQRRAVAAWVERLGIRCRSPFQRVRELSGGNQQKVALARLLLHDADVFLLDEPTRGIDVASKAQVYGLIDELAARGKAILMISSYPAELLGVCDRVAVMCRGRLGEARPAAELTEHELMLAATGGEAV